MLQLDRPSPGARAQLGALHGHSRFCQARQFGFYPLPGCALSPVGHPCQSLGPDTMAILTPPPARSGLMLGSPLPNWPLTEPRSPLRCHFGVLSCSITGEKKSVYSNPCINIRTQASLFINSWLNISSCLYFEIPKPSC